MTERREEHDITAEQQGHDLVELARSAEFGTPQYEALSDFFALHALEGKQIQYEKNALSKPDDPEHRQSWESAMRVNEQKIALLEHEIYMRQSRSNGYAKVYLHVDVGFDDLSTLASNEAEVKFPGDEPRQRTEKKEIFSRFFDEAEEIVDQKQEWFHFL